MIAEDFQCRLNAIPLAAQPDIHDDQIGAVRSRKFDSFVCLARDRHYLESCLHQRCLHLTCNQVVVLNDQYSRRLERRYALARGVILRENDTSSRHGHVGGNVRK